MPVMEVRSIVTGTRGVSLPFSDFCEPLIGADVVMDEAVSLLKAYGRVRGWRYFEMRGSGDSAVPSSASYYRHDLDLSPGIVKVASAFRDSTARNIKKAEKEGVTVTISDSMQSLRQFVHLNYLTRRDHGLPPQPERFFRKLYEHIISRGKGITVLAFHGGRPVAGAICFHYRDQAVFKFGASDKGYQHLRANNRVMWEAIQWYAAREYKNFCFGRTDLENEGLRQFKRGWGTDERLVGYHKYDLQKGAFASNSLTVKDYHSRVFANMPLPLLKIAGSFLYRHMA